MKTIKIKRSTDDGLVSCVGVLLEWQGFQFCLTDVANQSMAIELGSGASAYNAYSIKPIKKMIPDTIEYLGLKGIRALTKSINQFKKEYPEFKYPVNEQVK